MSRKKQLTDIWEAIALTNETLANSVRSINRALASHQNTLDSMLDTIKELSNLNQETADLILEHLAPQNSQETSQQT